MSTCLCCSENVPVTSDKVCPLCGHRFKGIGWWGIDAHWHSRHDSVMPYEDFWSGLCAAHRGKGGNLSAAPIDPKEAPGTVSTQYREALARRSSHVENILTHALIAEIAKELWRRDPWLDLQVFKADVDDSGFDLVLGCQGLMRYVQIKQTHLDGTAVKYSLRLDFTKMVGACAVVLVYQGTTLEIDHCLFLGGAPTESIPDVEGNRISQSPGRRTADGIRKIRENYRDVPRKDFEGPLTIPELVDRMFPGEQQSSDSLLGSQ